METYLYLMGFLDGWQRPGKIANLDLGHLHVSILPAFTLPQENVKEFMGSLEVTVGGFEPPVLKPVRDELFGSPPSVPVKVLADDPGSPESIQSIHGALLAESLYRGAGYKEPHFTGSGFQAHGSRMESDDPFQLTHLTLVRHIDRDEKIVVNLQNYAFKGVV